MNGKECNNGNEGCRKEGRRKGKSVDVKRNIKMEVEEKWKNDSGVYDISCKSIKGNNGDILEQTSDILKRFTSRSQHRERANREVIVKQSTPLYPRRSKVIHNKHNKDNNNNLKVNVYKHPNININNQKVHTNNNNNNNYIVKQYNCKEKIINNTVNHNYPNEINTTNQMKRNVVTDNYKLNNNNNNIISNVTTTTTSFNKIINQNINPPVTVIHNNTNTNRTNKLNTKTCKIKPKEINYQAKYEKLKHELDKLKSELIKERQKGNEIKKELSKYEKKEKQYDDITQTNTEITKSNESIYNKILLSETIRTEQQNLINSLQLEYNRIKQCMYNQYGEIPSSLTKPYTTPKPTQTPLSKQHNIQPSSNKH